MGFLSSLFGSNEPASARVEPRFTAGLGDSLSLENPSVALSDLTEWPWGPAQSGTFGPAVTETMAMRISTVFACVELRAALISSAPLNIYHDTPAGGRQVAKNNRLYRLLHTSPYPGRPLTSQKWRQMWAYHLLLWGNHYSIIRYDGAGRVIGFDPVLPWQVTVQLRGDGTKLYVVRRPFPFLDEVVDSSDMLHFMGPNFDGAIGLSRIASFARDPIALASVLQEQTGRVHENAARPSGMMTLPPGINADGIKRVRAQFNDAHTGRGNAGKVIFGENGQVYTPFQMSPEDLNTLAARQYQGADICRFFNTPPHMIGEAAGTSAWGTGIEQLTLGFMNATLNPMFCDLEGELNAKLFSTPEYYAGFDRTELVALDAVTAANVAQTEIQSGVQTINGRRRQLQRPDVPGGDEPLVNSTMISLERALTAPPPPPKSTEPKPLQEPKQ